MMMELPDWDLLAVVRSCTSTSTAAASSAPVPPKPALDLHNHQPTPPLPPPTLQQTAYGAGGSSSSFGFGGELQDIFKHVCRPSHHLCFSTMEPQQQQQEKKDEGIRQIRLQSSQFVFGTTTTTTTPKASSSPVSTTATSSSSSPGSGNFSISSIFGSSTTASHTQTNGGNCTRVLCSATPQKTKKRKKSVQKKVFHVPAEGLSSDMWAWRKYGQKPIKGSPYPRGYYRCSSSKGCSARKQVERNRSDPKMFIVTYTGDHNHALPTHRNSLAGSTRLKPPTTATSSSSANNNNYTAAAVSSPSATASSADHPESEMMMGFSSSSSPAASAGSDPSSPVSDAAKLAETKAEFEVDGEEGGGGGGGEEEDEMGLSDMVLNDDFFVGFEDLDDGGGSGWFFEANGSYSTTTTMDTELPPSWMATATATAAGGS